MDDLRRVARESVQQVDIPPTTPPADIALPESIDTLWQEISSRRPNFDKEVKHACPKLPEIPSCYALFLTRPRQICEDLLVALGFLGRWSPKSVSQQDEETISRIYEWASSASLPSLVLAEISDPDLSDGRRNGSFYYYPC